jgi:site-specific DNA recombinase
LEVNTMRVLPVIRLSSLDEATTSPGRQLDQITHAARAKEPDVVILDPVYDLDVSGAVSPFARSGLGPWLTDPDKIAAYDALFAAKLDRLTRSLQDFVALAAWCGAHGKTLLSVSESLDLSTRNGRLAANTLAIFAEFERERMAERRREALVTLRKNGWWNGGVAPYGYRPEPDGPHWVLVPDEAQAAVVRRMAEAVLAGTPASAVARALAAGGIPPARGRAWTVSSVLFVLRNCVLYGQLRDNEKRPLRGPDGLPLTLRSAILDRDTWQRVQTRLSAASFTKGAVPTALLSGVAFCACGASLYSNRQVLALG